MKRRNVHTTPISLLERVRRPGEEAAWARLVEMYTPLLLYWARRRGLQESDAADLVQDVFAQLVNKLPEFVYDRQRSFRNWLRTILFNKDRDRVRRAAHQPITVAPMVEPSAPGDVEALWDAEYRELLVARALELMQNEFQPTTWKACWEVVVSGRPAAEVAAELGLTIGAVYAAKSRVLRRLRRELDGLLE